MFIGAIWGLGVLKVVALVFLVLFLLELPAEVPLESVTACAIVGLIIATMGWAGSLWVKSHMHIVGHWLTF